MDPNQLQQVANNDYVAPPAVTPAAATDSLPPAEQMLQAPLVGGDSVSPTVVSPQATSPLQPAQWFTPSVAAQKQPDAFVGSPEPVVAAPVVAAPVTAPAQPEPVASAPMPIATGPAPTPMPAPSQASLPAFMQPDPAPYHPAAPMPDGATAPAEVIGETPDKSFVTALLLSWMFGAFGLDRIYLNRVVSGVVKLLTFGGLGAWAAADLVLLGFGRTKAVADVRPLGGYAKNGGWAKKAVIPMTLLQIIVMVGLMAMVVITLSAL